jgi:hypothetical protein
VVVVEIEEGPGEEETGVPGVVNIVAFQLFLLKINFCQILMASQIFSHWRFRG